MQKDLFTSAVDSNVSASLWPQEIDPHTSSQTHQQHTHTHTQD